MNETCFQSQLPRISLESTKEHFEEWRRTRNGSRQKIPGHLWEEAFSLVGIHRPYQICKVLRLNYGDFKKKAQRFKSDRPSSFVELNLDEMNFTGLPGNDRFCFLELERRDGTKLRVYSREESSRDLKDVLSRFMEVVK